MQLKSDQKVTLSLKFMDTTGNPVAAPASVVWSTSDASVASVSTSEDGLSATVTAGKVGASVITASAGTLKSELTIAVEAGPAVEMAIVPGDPILK